MQKYKDKFFWRNFFYSNFIIIILILILIFISNEIFDIYKKYRFTKAEYSFVEKKVKEAESKMNVSNQKLSNIKEEEGKEKYIRETYSVKKEGEEVVIIYKSTSSTYEIPRSISKWESFKAFIKNIFNR